MDLITLDKRLIGPLVYLVYHKDLLLYVGSSIRGILRFSGHHVFDDDILNMEDVRIDVILCDNESSCRSKEAELIRKLDPIINKKNALNRISAVKKDVDNYFKLEKAKKFQRENEISRYYVHIARTKE